MAKALVILIIGIVVLWCLAGIAYVRPDLEVKGYFSFRNDCHDLVGKEFTLSAMTNLDPEAYIVSSSGSTSEVAFKKEVDEALARNYGQVFLRKSFFPDVHYRCQLKMGPDHIVTDASYSFWTE